MIKKTITKYIFLLSILALPFNLFSQYLTEDIFKFSRAMGYIANFYVDTVNSPQLVETAIINV